MAAVILAHIHMELQTGTSEFLTFSKLYPTVSGKILDNLL